MAFSEELGVQNRAANDELASVYDRFTRGHDHAGYQALLERIARAHGFARGPVLDLGCGTGATLRPWLEAGYDGTGVDVSPGMVAQARKALGEYPKARVLCGDVQELADIGAFFLATAVGDPFNYLLDCVQLERAFRATSGCLVRNGLLVFDVNTRLAYETVFAETSVLEVEDQLFVWRGRGWADPANRLASAEVIALSPGAGESWTGIGSLHHQRWHDSHDVLRALARSGLELCAIHGLGLDGFGEEFDEDVHRKALFVARKP
jgi:SAM-dependent methyltransferase